MDNDHHTGVEGYSMSKMHMHNSIQQGDNIRRLREIEKTYQISITNNNDSEINRFGKSLSGSGAVGHSKNLSKAGLQIF